MLMVIRYITRHSLYHRVLRFISSYFFIFTNFDLYFWICSFLRSERKVSISARKRVSLILSLTGLLSSCCYFFSSRLRYFIAEGREFSSIPASLAYSILPSTLFSSVVAVIRKFVNLSENSVPFGPNRHHFPAMERQKISYFLPFSSEDAKSYFSFWPQKL